MVRMPSDSFELHVRRVVDALERDVEHDVDRETLTAVVEADFQRYAARAKFTDFVPVLVERTVRDKLRRHRRSRVGPARARRF
jgi:hypothetical protein